MIGKNLSRRERVLMIASLLVAAGIAGWQLLVEPTLERNRVTSELVPVRERLLLRRQDTVARKASVLRDIDAVNAQIDKMSARLLAAAAPPVAASELQKIAKETAAEVSMEVRSERILAPVERGELLEIPVEIAVSGEIRNLVDLLARLEAKPKLLTVGDVKVRVMNVAQPKDLLATITLSGFIMPGKTMK